MKKSLAENFTLNFIKNFLGIIFPLITFQYASRVLKSSGIGKVSFVESVVGYFTILAALGINAYGIREVSKVRDDRKKLERISSELFTINCLTTIVAYIIFLCTIISVDYLKGYRTLLIIQSVGIIFTTFTMDWFYTSLEEYRYITIRAFLFQIISLLMMVLFVKSESDIEKYAIICVIANVGSGILNFIHSRKFVKIKLEINKNLLIHMKPILYIFGTNLASFIYLDLDKIMIEIMWNDTYVGLYTAAVKITKTLSTLMSSITNIMLPRVSYSLENGNFDEFEKLVIVTGNYTLMLVIPVACGILSLNSEIIELFCGSGYLQAKLPLTILGFDIAIAALNRIFAWVILVPLGYENKVLKTTIIGAVSNFVLNVFFIKSFSISGAAISTCISELIVMLVCIVYCKGKVKLKGVIKYAYQYSILAMSFLIIRGILDALGLSGIVMILLQIFFSVLVYCLGLFIFKNPYMNQICNIIKCKVKGE